MENRKGFTLIELLVVIAIIALLLSILVPALKMGKMHAQQVICKSNLKQWGLVWRMYSDNYDGKFPYWKVTGGGTYHRGSWIQPMRQYFPGREKMLVCPTATRKDPEQMAQDGTYPGDAHGGILYAYSMGTPTLVEIANGTTEPEWCSYGMNNWCANSAGESGNVQNRPARELWQSFQQTPSPSQVPLMLDSMWRGGGPQANDTRRIAAPQYEGQWRGIEYEISHFAVPRHTRGRVNVIFVDLHVEDVPLKGLWGLKWHKSYDMSTLPSTGWPAWMEKYN